MRFSLKCLKMQTTRYFTNPWLSRKPDSAEFLKNKGVQDAWDVINLVLMREPPHPSKGDGGLYVGVGGIGYMCYHIALSPLYQSSKPFLVQKGVEYITAALQFLEQNRGRRRDQCGFLLGATGIYAVAAALYQLAGDIPSANKFSQMYSALAHTCLPRDFLPSGSDELFVGRAGYVYGVLWLRKVLGHSVVPDPEMFNLCRAMWESGKIYSQRQKSPSPLMYAYYDTEYLGAAHGLCFILQVLMTVPGFFQACPEAEKDVQASLDYLLSVQGPEGDFPATTDEVPVRNPDTTLVHWCHGSPGVVYAMARAYLVWRDEKYLESCIKCGEAVWQRGLLKKGPGICHGVAGNGYVFLLLYRLTNDSKYLSRAQRFALFMQTEQFKREARTPDCPFSLYEGLAGTACFLTDLLIPQQAVFPFSDVFLD